jgi:hypothetical protein
MRAVIGLVALAFAAAANPPVAGAQGAPPGGSYLRQCRDVRMEGMFLHAWCQGSRGAGQSSLNVAACRTDIGVDPDGGLICGGPGAGGPPPPDYRPPHYRPSDDRPSGGDYRPPGGDYRPGHGGGRWGATLYERPRYRGRSIRITGDTANLDDSGFNDRVGSIRFDRRSGPWQICTDSRFRGRCVTVNRDVGDTDGIGMGEAVSSLRPLR